MGAETFRAQFFTLQRAYFSARVVLRSTSGSVDVTVFPVRLYVAVTNGRSHNLSTGIRFKKDYRIVRVLGHQDVLYGVEAHDWFDP